jgi:hypothetical protein
MKTIERKWVTINHSDNDTRSERMPLTYDMHAISLYFSGTLTIAGTATTRLDREPLGVIKKIRLIANGTTELCALSGPQLYELNHIKRGVAGTLTPCSALTAAAYSVVAHLILDLADLTSKVPLDTMLRTGQLSTLDIEIQWGDGDDIVTGGTSHTLTAASVVISTVESYGTAKERPLLLQKLYAREETIAATTSNFQVNNLPVGNLYRSLTLITKDAGVRESDILNKLALKIGEEVIINLDAAVIREKMKQDFQIETLPAGVYHIDFAMKLELDVTVGTGTTTLEIITQEFVPPSTRK